MTPRTYTSAANAGYVTCNVIRGTYKVRVDLKPRFFRQGLKPIISFWLTYKGAKRLGIYL